MSERNGLPPKLGGRLLAGVVFGALVYVGIALWADLGSIRAALVGFPLALLPVVMALSFANYAVRFARWERYRKLIGIRMQRGTSFVVYLAGLALTVTPGKLGEAFKSVLVRRIDGTPIHRSAPIVVAERFTDLCGFLLLLAIGGIASEPEWRWIFWATLLLCAVLLALVGSPRVARVAIACVERLPLVSRLASRVEGALDSARLLLRPRELPFAVLVATVGWSLECIGFWLVASALAPRPVPILFAVFAYALSAIAGAVLIVFPGGLGVTEASMGGLLTRDYVAGGLASEAAHGAAAAATILTRLCTLWFAVGVGLVATALFARRTRGAGAVPSAAGRSIGP